MTYEQVPLAVRVLYRSIIVISTFYIATSHITMPDSLLEESPLSSLGLRVLWVATILAGVLALVRPSFGLMTVEYILVNKSFLAYSFGGIALTSTDYVTLIDSGAFMAIGLTLYGLILKTRIHNYLCPFDASSEAAPPRFVHPLIILSLAMIALHFGNYFYGAVIKMALGEHVSSWVLVNRTYQLILMALESRVLPISFDPNLVQHVYDAFAAIYVPFNFVVLIAQFFCIIALNNIRWTIAITVCFDLMHVGIFILTGIFFWKWILLNLAIVAALSLIVRTSISLQHRVLVMILVLASPVIYKIPPFAWFDTAAANTLHIHAITDDGEVYEVPSNYFLPLAVTIVQQRMQWPLENKFPTTTWGTTREWDRLAELSNCSTANTIEEWFWFIKSHEQITNIIQRYHTYILSVVDDRGLLNYDIYPHHFFTMPWELQEFRSLDKRRIVAYRYISEAACLSLDEGRLVKDVKRSQSFDIPVRGD
ncbi:MAG: hypothetical protein AAF495_00105 [Pseudomonadota bacterium]